MDATNKVPTFIEDTHHSRVISAGLNGLEIE